MTLILHLEDDTTIEIDTNTLSWDEVLWYKDGDWTEEGERNH